MNGPTRPEMDVDSIRTQLRVELKEQLGPWVRRQFYIIVLVGGVLGALGIPVVVRLAVGDLVTAELQSSKEDLSAIRAEALDAATDAMVAAEKARMFTDDATKELEEARESINVAIAEADAAAALAQQAAEQAGEALKTAEEAGQLVNAIPNTSPDVLTGNDKAALRVRQEAVRTNDSVPGRDSKYVELYFYLDVDSEKADHPKSRIIAHVDKVEYIFDERWFKPPVRTSTERFEDFEYSTRVWGPTRVKAAIYLTDPPEILVREGLMNLNETTFLKPSAN